MAKGKKEYRAVHYDIKVYEEPSEYGISKLTLRIGEEEVANYDRGWDIEPTCKEAEMALSILLNEN